MHSLPTRDLFGRARRGLLAAALLAGVALPVAMPALPAAAQAAPVGSISFSPSTSNVPSVPAPPTQAPTFTVDVMASASTTAVFGWQFGFTYDPAKLSVTAINMSDEFLTAGGNTFHNPCDFTTTAGTVVGCASALTSPSATGVTAAGRLMQVTFRPIANGSAPLTITPGSTGSFFSGAGGVTLATTLNNGAVNVGPVAAANLAIQNATTVATATPAGASFNVTFTVANTGTAAAPAGSATVAVSNATPATQAVPVAAINAGANSGTLTAGPFTLTSGSTLAQVTITDGSATGSTAYSFAAFNSTGTTALTATLAGFITLTAPPAVSNFALAVGPNTFGGTGNTLNVKSNLSSYSVTVAGDNGGQFTEFDPGTSAYVAPPAGAQLANMLHVLTGSVNVALSGAAQPFVSNTRPNYAPSGAGDNYTITYNQLVTGNDAPVNPPHTYREVVTWAAAGVF
jgi:hypothetical protein